MNNFHIIAFTCLLTLSAGVIAVADARANDLIPPVTAVSAPDDGTVDVTTTHPMMRMTPDKSELIKLDRNAISVIVSNPAHLSVLLDTPNMLVLIPRAPGATYFTALDEKGEVIMQRHVIVASPKKNYVRIRRSCANSTGRGSADCQATSVYFCPDICHEVDLPQMGDQIETPRIPKEVPSGSTQRLFVLTEEGKTEDLEEVEGLIEGVESLEETTGTGE